MKTILVTGGLGFIGSNFIRHMLNKYDYKIINIDKVTYSANFENLKDVENNPNYYFVKGDICDKSLVEYILIEHKIDTIINFAAESHVDRSILDADDFVKTDILGTQILLEAAKNSNIKRYIQISTDEVYGSINEGSFTEESNLKPNSPYAASKAGGDLIARSYSITYKTPVIIVRSSNNYRPYQYPEKLIPLFITNLIENIKIPLYGDGLNVRDWIHVLDNCEAIDVVLHKGIDGEVYNISSNNEKSNVFITKFILKELDKPESFIEFVSDRKGHDRRYSLNSNKLRNLGWEPKFNFEESLKDTIRWYVENKEWWQKIKSNDFKEYYKKQYELRE